MVIHKAKLTSKGQVTIPKAVREKMDLRPGDELEFFEEDGYFKVRRVLPKGWLDPWVGYLKELRGVDVDELIEEMRGR
jgi:AbrB family looped-hinge helix DNA binding protein